MVWLQNDNLYVRVRSGIVCTEDKGDVREFKIGTVVPGQWHTLAFGVLWHKEKEGWFKVWLDNKLRIDKEDIKTFLDTDDRMFQFRVGIYPNWWTWDGSGHPFIKDGLKRKREIFIDHIGFGPELADADAWSTVVTEHSVQTKIKTLQTFVRRMKRDNPNYNVAAELDLLSTLKEQLADLVIKKDPETGNAMKQELLREKNKRSRNSHKSEPNLAFKPVEGNEVVTSGESEGVEDGDEDARGADGLPITSDEEAEKGESSAALKAAINGDVEDSVGAGTTATDQPADTIAKASTTTSATTAAARTTNDATSDGSTASSDGNDAASETSSEGSALSTALKEKGVSDESGEVQPMSSATPDSNQGVMKDQAEQDAAEVAHFKGVDANTLQKLTGQAPPEPVEPPAPPASNKNQSDTLGSLSFDIIFFIGVVGILYYLFQPFKSQEVVPPRLGGGSSHGQPKRDDANIALTHLERGNVAPIVDEKDA